MLDVTYCKECDNKLKDYGYQYKRIYRAMCEAFADEQRPFYLTHLHIYTLKTIFSERIDEIFCNLETEGFIVTHEDMEGIFVKVYRFESFNQHGLTGMIFCRTNH